MLSFNQMSPSTQCQHNRPSSRISDSYRILPVQMSQKIEPYITKEWLCGCMFLIWKARMSLGETGRYVIEDDVRSQPLTDSIKRGLFYISLSIKFVNSPPCTHCNESLLLQECLIACLELSAKVTVLYRI